MEGSSTVTGWKRRSNAASFSICLRYSLKVVAPITWISPRERAGFKIFAAFMEPSESPAPTRLWTSSINRITFPASLMSSTSPLTRLSNCPRNWVPATKAVKSSKYNFLSARRTGTSPLAKRWAMPSATAVLPTPGSPMRQGLFLLRRFKI